LIELLVVIAIIAILASMLLPALSRAKDRAKTIYCGVNTMQLGKAFLFYAEENKEKLPDFYTRAWMGGELVPNGKWWWQLLEEGRYAPNYFDKGAPPSSGPAANSMIMPGWKCPSVKPQDIQRIWDWPSGGYGPEEGFVFGWAYYTSPGEAASDYQGSRKLSEIHRPFDVWLVGDTGVPKGTRKPPYGGFLTMISTYSPLDDISWFPYSQQNQPACRHANYRANVTFVDGHLETWRYEDFRQNRRNVFAEFNDP
jgi:prepilin-type processing-associated H-X9-DG protein